MLCKVILNEQKKFRGLTLCLCGLRYQCAIISNCYRIRFHSTLENYFPLASNIDENEIIGKSNSISLLVSFFDVKTHEFLSYCI